MIFITSKVTKLKITGVDKLDDISVFIEDLKPGQGEITISCGWDAWTCCWDAIGDQSVAKFFCSAHEQYLAKELSDVDPDLYDIDKIRKIAEDHQIYSWSEYPLHDYELLSLLFGPDPVEWSDRLPKKPNPRYTHLIGIIKTVQSALSDVVLNTSASPSL